MASCSKCGSKKKAAPANTAADLQRMAAAEEMRTMNDNDYVLILYTHPNRGKHGVIGAATKKNYGYRSGGEQFLVHKDDIRAQPQFYRAIQKAEAIKFSTPTPAAPPPPRPKFEVVPPVQEPVPPTVPVPVMAEGDTVRETVVQSSKPKNIVDLGLLPGVTPAIEKNLRAAGIITKEDFLKAGVDGLVEVKYVGLARAEAIMEYINGLS